MRQTDGTYILAHGDAGEGAVHSIIIFHEKEGRRHAHCVWSRINVTEMKAINLRHFKLKLRDMSRQLYLEHGWQMPRGLMNSEERDPLNFTIEEWQQAKRAKRDPQTLKEMFQECWAVSDTKAAFANALEERGFYLATNFPWSNPPLLAQTASYSGVFR